jgi:hypothetical protein
MLHGTCSLSLAYTLVLAAMLAGLCRERASLERCLLAPFLAAGATVVAALAIVLFALPWRVLASLLGVLQILFNALIAVAMGYVAGRIVARHQPGHIGRLYQWGAALLGLEQGRKRPFWPVWFRDTLAPEHPSGSLTLAGVPVPPEDETRHFMLIGTAEAGRSIAIRELLVAARARGDRAVITDPDGGHLERFYDASRGDLILHVFRPDAHRWDLFGEITQEQHIEQLSRALIPDNRDSERALNEDSRTFLSELIRHCLKSGNRDDADLLRLVTTATQADLRGVLIGTPAARCVAEGSGKLLSAILSLTNAALRPIEHTGSERRVPLSVRRWVREGASRGGVLFLPYSAGERASLRCVLSAWTRLAILAALECPAGDQHLWFVVDGLDALATIDDLKDALVQLGRHGGRCVLGFESIERLSSIYAAGAAHTLVERAANTLVLRCPAGRHGRTAELASRLIGQAAILSAHSRRSGQHSGWWEQLFAARRQPPVGPGVLATQIERLPDFQGFLKLASEPGWRLVQLSGVRVSSGTGNRPCR